jgi:hypothetical protein
MRRPDTPTSALSIGLRGIDLAWTMRGMGSSWSDGNTGLVRPVVVASMTCENGWGAEPAHPAPDRRFQAVATSSAEK